MTSRPFRKDIQGLRAIAVLLVVSYHFWPSRLTGGYIGVDVFFVISGYLITDHLLAHPPRTATDFGAFWVRRIRRLLPASLTVLATTLVATRVLLPETLWSDTARNATAAAFYVLNWSLAFGATDYLSANAAPTPVEHYWSLSVEEQFYLVWPLLIGFVAWRWQRGRVSAIAAIGLVTVASFAYSVYETAAEPAQAYFVTPTRMWELGLGGLLAAVGSRTASRRWAGAAAWGGLLLILISAVQLTGASAFPGWIAAIPVLGTVAVIWAAPSGAFSPMAVLGRRPVQWLGGISYSVYLWHWPVIVVARNLTEGNVSKLLSLALIGLTLLLAAATKRFIEDPWRRHPHGMHLRRPLIAALAGMLIVAGLAGAQRWELNHRAALEAQRIRVASSQGCFGSDALAKGPGVCPRNNHGAVLPSPADALTDRSEAFDHRCFETPPYGQFKECHFGNGPIKVALVGNSHAAHWLPALKKIPSLSITTMVASECTTVDKLIAFNTQKKAKGCLEWTKTLRERSAGNRFQLVITSQRNVHPIQGTSGAAVIPALTKAFREFLVPWLATGTRLMILRDTPFPAKSFGYVPNCVAAHPADQNFCSAPVNTWLPDDPLVDAARGMAGTYIADFTKYLCEPLRCYGVNGGVITYSDGSHMTQTYAMTLAPYLKVQIDKALAAG